jgi:hypothetical protein
VIEDGDLTNLSDILHTCYTDYGFDYVTIFDYACRTCKSTPTMAAENEKEIADGDRLKREFKDKRLGSG